MRKFNMILLVVGLVITLVGMTGAFYYSKVDNKYQEQEVKVSRSFDAQRIKKIDMDLKNVKLQIVAGDTFKLEGRGESKQPKITTEGDTLKLQLEGTENPQATVNVNPFHIKMNTQYKLTVPQSDISRLNINSDWSAVDVDRVVAKEMVVQMQKGAFDMERSQIGSFDGHMQYGSFDVENTTFEKVAMTNREGSTVFDGVPADIPMTLNNQLGTLDVSFAQPLQNVSIESENNNGYIDMEDLINYAQIKDRDVASDPVIKINNREGTVTLED
ncbi:DUF4097 family beta strand repeat-containing protein [Staphylococcus rostri]|uniref:DUF4097 domain-containing protein n=1 Tax=Staphylococcus rostri TaxID=522262 RepID=A0A2K3YU51_9STAP|nr:DUF4097 family beta strand repeat-containing protein [Staphylococcus rostri]PNZ29121.1 hypothetical protein CD122_03040 [Staphylococcus rostri]